MITTNHDTSTTGFNCELSVMLDCDHAQLLFEEEMHVHQYSGYSTTAVYEFGIHEERPADSVEDLFEFSDDISEQQFRRALFNVHMRDRSYTTWKPTPRNFFDEHPDRHDYETYWHDTFMDQLNEDFSIPEYAKEETFLLIDELTSEQVKHKYRVKSTHGYCQGDYALVLVPNKYGWDDEHKNSIDTAIDHICWDQPIYARLHVECQETGEVDEIYLEEFLDDSYDWDRDKVIDGLKKIGTDNQGESVARNQPLPISVIEWVQQSLPEYPDIS